MQAWQRSSPSSKNGPTHNSASCSPPSANSWRRQRQKPGGSDSARRLPELIAAQASWPGRVQVIGHSWADHFDTADLAVVDQERFGDQNAGRPIEVPERVLPAVRQRPLVHSPLIEYGVRPDDAALTIDERVATTVDGLHHEVVTELELRQTVHGKGVDGIRRFVGRPGNVRGRRSVFDAMAVVGERVRSRALNAPAVVLLQAGEVAVGDGDHLLA